MNDLSIISCGIHFGKAGVTFPLHKHSGWEMMFYRHGRTAFGLDDAVVQCHAGLLLTTRPGSVHTEYAHTDYEVIIVALDAQSEPAWPTICYDDGDQTLDRLFRTLLREWTENNTGRDAMIAGALMQLNVYLTRATAQLSVEDRTIAEAKRLIHDGLHRHIRITEVARLVGVCPAVLRAQFQRSCGCSPIDYIKGVRVSQALSWLRHSDLTLDAIASVCGYTSASHLSRDIKAATGLTPGGVRSEATAQAPSGSAR
ncbi:MAG TPA: AraC family transcriptional regulator [Capsulimonadaceae bacterium]|jgi:AraC-like DNA-binding protein